MRFAVAIVIAIVAASPASADDKALLRAYEGQIIISPDPVPANVTELDAYAKANVTKDRRYALVKGPPWQIHLVGFLAKDPGTAPVTLVIYDLADKKQEPLASIDVSSRRRIVIAKASATTAAGFEPNKTYVVQLMLKSKSLARAELELRN